MKNTMQWIMHHNKSIMALLSTGFVTWLALRSNGVTEDEWIQIVVSALGAAGVVLAIPNVKKPNDSNKI